MLKNIVSIKDFEESNSQKLERSVKGYYSSGADDEHTLKRNISKFSEIFILPRVLKNISKISLKTKFLGQNVNLPFGAAPFAMQKLLHSEGEKILAKKCRDQKVPFTLSLLSTTSIYQVSKQNGQGIRILQLYFLKNASYTQKIIQFAQQNGFTALAITVDTQTFGKRRINILNKFQPQVHLQIFEQLGLDIQFKCEEDPARSFTDNLDMEVTWKAIAEIKKTTKLKIILKGIVHPEDIYEAEKANVDAIWISNHGGRQLDTAPATIEVLKAIKGQVNKIGSKMQVYIDGGIRKGSDIFKCLALGADHVFLARGLLYALIDGKEGIDRSFEIFKKELITTMMLSGARSIEQIDSKFIYTESNLNHLSKL